MPQTNSIIREKETIEPLAAKNIEVDEYTARMDRMVTNLKQRCQNQHQKELKTMLIWISVGILVTIASIYLMLNHTYNGEPLGFLNK